MKIDPASFGVMAAALASSLVVGFAMTHAGGPARAEAATPDAVAADGRLTKAADGHFWAPAVIEAGGARARTRMLVDTGASVVALTREDALRLKLVLSPQAFTQTVTTASGPVRAAPVRLRELTVAGATVKDVPALVFEDGLPHSLLGMSYLGRLSSFQATPSALTLTP